MLFVVGNQDQGIRVKQKHHKPSENLIEERRALFISPMIWSAGRESSHDPANESSVWAAVSDRNDRRFCARWLRIKNSTCWLSDRFSWEARSFSSWYNWSSIPFSCKLDIVFNTSVFFHEYSLKFHERQEWAILIYLHYWKCLDQLMIAESSYTFNSGGRKDLPRWNRNKKWFHWAGWIWWILFFCLSSCPPSRGAQVRQAGMKGRRANPATPEGNRGLWKIAPIRCKVNQAEIIQVRSTNFIHGEFGWNRLYILRYPRAMLWLLYSEDSLW